MLVSLYVLPSRESVKEAAGAWMPTLEEDSWDEELSSEEELSVLVESWEEELSFEEEFPDEDDSLFEEDESLLESES